MDDKTAQLRDIFIDVADEETVTETQQEGHGSLATDQESADRLQSVIDQLREKFDAQFALDDSTLCRLVRAFYAGDDDAAIAETVDCSPETVFRTRMKLHLIRERDLPGPELEARLRDAEGDPDTAQLAAEFDHTEETVRRANEAVAAVNRSRRVSQRFRTAFEEALTDADLSVQFTAGAHEDGLEEATEDAEVDVEL